MDRCPNCKGDLPQRGILFKKTIQCSNCKKEFRNNKYVNPKRYIYSFLVIAVISLLAYLGYRSATAPHEFPDFTKIEKNEVRYAAMDFVKERLKSPFAAKFQNSYDFTVWQNGDGIWNVQGYVDAPNSFGAVMRNRFLCTLDKKGNQWYLVNLKIPY